MSLKQAKYLFSSCSYICFCIDWIHGFCKSADVSQDREERINSLFITGGSFFCNTSGKCNHLCMVFLGKSGNAYRSFSHGSLEIQTSLTGNYNIGIGKFLFQSNGIQNQFNARYQSCTDIGEECETKPSGSTGSRGITIIIPSVFDVTLAKCAISLSNCFFLSSVTPFCGPYT